VPRTAPQPDPPLLTIESAGAPAVLYRLLPPDSVRWEQSDEQRRNMIGGGDLIDCHSACNDPSTDRWINNLARRSTSGPRAD